MKVSKALGLGFQQSKKSLQMILLLYGINLLIALPLAMAFRSTLIRSFDNSLAVEMMLKDFDATVYSDFMKYHGRFISTLLSQIPWLIVLYMINNMLTAGGVISYVNDPQPFSFSAFFEKCGKFFYRLLKLLTILAVVFVVVAFFWFFVVGAVFTALVRSALSEKSVVVWFVVMAAVFLFPVVILIIIGDYAKVAAVVNDETRMFKTFWQSVKFVIRNFFSTVTLQLSIVSALAVSVVVYWLIEAQIGMSSAVAIVTMFFVQQGFVSFKVWTRVWTFASEVQLFRAREPSGEAVVVPVIVPQVETAANQPPAIASRIQQPSRRVRKPSRRRLVAIRSRKKKKV